MRIAFVAANRELLPDPVIPLGLLSVLEACPERHERHVLDLCFEPDPVGALRSLLRDVRPDLVAISLRNLQSADYSDASENLDAYRALVEAVREQTPAPVVLGGGGYSVLPGPLLDALGADFGIAGEGEGVFRDLVAALEAGGHDLDRVDGLYRRVNGRAVPPSRPAAFLDLSMLGFVDRSRVDRRHYERSGIESVQTRRGCGLKCSYCSYPSIEGRASRLRPVTTVADELEHIREVAPEVSHFFVVDSVFNLPQAHAFAVSDAIRERRIELPWTCYANPIGFTLALAERMAAAGCVGMEVGADSGDDGVLLRLQKGFDTTAVRRIHEIALEAGLLDCHTFIVGTPDESLDEVRRSLDFIADLDPHAAIVMVWNDDAETLAPAARSPARSERAELRGQILELLDRASAHQPRWVVPPLGRRFDARRFALLRRRGLRGPLWQHIPRGPA